MSNTTRLNAQKTSILELIKKENLAKVAIFTGTVDPDGLASGLAMEILIEKFGGKSTLFYKGGFTRGQNKVFRDLLCQDSHSDEEFKIEDAYTCIICADCPVQLCPVQPDYVIDHHENIGEAKKGMDIQIIGATSSLMCSYLKEAEIDFSDEVGQKLATALLIGIVTDTKNGTVDTCCDLDYEAMSICHQYKDTKLYKDVINYPKPMYYNDLFCKAWENKAVEGTTLVSGVGVIPEIRVGILSDLAERFIETEGVNTAAVFGIVDNCIDISIRTNSKLNVDEFVKNAFGGGGGKVGAARAIIKLPILFQNIPNELNEELYNTCVKIVKHKALQIAGDKK